MNSTPWQPPRNRLIASLGAQDQKLLMEHLEPRPLRVRHRAEPANRKVRNIYFLEQGIASVMAISGSGRRQSEIAMIGPEGMTGIAAVLGARRSPHETYMMVAGRGLCITADRLRGLMLQSRTLLDALTCYALAVAVQTAQTALANALGTVEERLARWLLMAHDRIQQDEIRLTHESVSVAIGVRRPGVTLGLRRLEAAGCVEHSRGAIAVRDREALRRVAKGLYGVPEAEYSRLFG